MSYSEQATDRLKADIVRAAELLFRSGVMQHSGHGNISARLDGERMVLTHRSNIENLTSNDLAVVSFGGEVLAGGIDSRTAEIVAMHGGVYQFRNQVGSIIHTHSPYLTAFALAHEPLPCVYEALLRFGVADYIPVVPWAPRGSEELVVNIISQLQQHPAAPAVLLANHGLLAFHEDPVQTARLVMVMEEAAEATLEARELGGEKPFPPGALEQKREQMAKFELPN
jgi:L-ribulose-5-phosphate 4-epimerase